MSVVVYTMIGCPACAATTRHLDKLGIPYDTEPMTKDIQDQARGNGILAAPVVLVEGKALWGGYRPDQLDQLA
jgi:glutaredoxin-like protein NrdH